MGLLDLADRLNWQQAASILGVSRSSFYRLVKAGAFPVYGRDGCRFYLKSEVQAWLERRAGERLRRQKGGKTP